MSITSSGFSTNFPEKILRQFLFFYRKCNIQIVDGITRSNIDNLLPLVNNFASGSYIVSLKDCKFITCLRHKISRQYVLMIKVKCSPMTMSLLQHGLFSPFGLSIPKTLQIYSLLYRGDI